MSASGIPEMVDGLEERLDRFRSLARDRGRQLKDARRELATAEYLNGRMRELLDSPEMACAECGNPRDDCDHPYPGEPADPWQHAWVPVSDDPKEQDR